MQKVKDALSLIAGGILGIAISLLALWFFFGTKLGAWIVLLAIAGVVLWVIWAALKDAWRHKQKISTPGHKLFRQISGIGGKYANGSYYIGYLAEVGHVEWIGVVTFDSWTGIPTCRALEPHIHEYGPPKNVSPNVPMILLAFYSDFPLGR